MTNTWTHAASRRLHDYLNRPDYTIPVGLGCKDAACSMAAIRLAYDGKLSDLAPPYMSRVIAEWVILMQDNCPSVIRNSVEWRGALMYAAAAKRENESAHARVFTDWTFDTVLPCYQPIAEEHGYGDRWAHMVKERSKEPLRPMWSSNWEMYGYVFRTMKVMENMPSTDDRIRDFVDFSVRCAMRVASKNLKAWQTFDLPGTLFRASKASA